MAIWFTSDHHFGHANIIKYTERPFNSVGHMNASMIGSWNGVVAPDDTVYYLGDFAMQPHLVAEILPQLNGKTPHSGKSRSLSSQDRQSEQVASGIHRCRV